MRLGEANRPRNMTFTLPYEGIWPPSLRTRRAPSARVRDGEKREMERALRLQAEEREVLRQRAVRMIAATPLLGHVVQSIADSSISRVVGVTSDGDVMLDDHGALAFAPFQFKVVEL